MKMVELNNITKKYGKRVILNNLSFYVNEGEIISLVGPSGCGKSTILNMIGLLETYDRGEIKIKGNILPKIESFKATRLRRNEINYLFQSYALISDMTINQNLLLAMYFLNMTEKIKQQKIDNILSRVGLFDLKHEFINTLSGGEQQRVALVRTILKPGNIILADEPTGSLDSQASDTVFRLLKKLCREYGKTAIIVTHDLTLASKTDRIIELEKL
ncbi:MAG: ABC transporter ATP-binding protein [Breznakia sp.]